MAGRPSITVIIAVRDGMPLLKETVESIRLQHYEPLELIVADDGSSDGTLEYLDTLGDFVSRVVRVGGTGPAAARNAGLTASSSEYVAFLDADDLWPDDTLKSLAHALLGNPLAGFAQGLIRNFRASANGEVSFLTLPYRFLNLGACLWRRELFASVGPLDATLNLCEDLDLLMRCWERDIPKAIVNRVTLHYRRHDANLTRNLSGAGFGTLKAYKRRIERIRKGEFQPSSPRLFDERTYIGNAPISQDALSQTAARGMRVGNGSPN